MAIDGLAGADPLAIISIPALTRQARKPEDAIAGVPFGGRQEKELLDTYFRIPGAPDAGKPYRAIWNPPSKAWVAERFAETSLQRQRRDRALSGVGLLQSNAAASTGSAHNWAIKPNAASELEFQALRLIDLAIWFGRNRDVGDLTELLTWFQEEFCLKMDAAWDLVPTLFIDGVPSSYSSVALAAEPVAASDLAQIVGANPPAVEVTDGLSELSDALKRTIRQKLFEIPEGIINTILRAWLRGDLVVLMGQPGTGKTAFSRLLADALSEYLGIASALTVPVDDEFDSSALIGYENLKGEPVLREFSKRVFLSDSPLNPVLVILEEFNLTTVESYLSSILIALEEPSRRVNLPGGASGLLPQDFFLIATCNSYLDEPSRSRLSYSTKRRTCIIEMPNLLHARYVEYGPEIISQLALDRVHAEGVALRERIADGRESTFDRIRLDALSTVSTLKDFSPDVLRYLEDVIGGILATPEGASFMTLGLLRDLILDVALAPRDRDAELAALLSSIETKLLHQLRGPHSRADELLASVAGIRGSERLGAALARMKSPSSDGLTTPL